MESVSQNGLLKQEEFTKFKERTVGLRFKQQVSYGIGAAMVFGLIGGVVNLLGPLVGPAIAGGAWGMATAAIVGLAAIPVVGISLIYLSAKFLSESTLMEQDFQAKKIGMAARGHGRAQEQEKPAPFPETTLLDKAELKDMSQPQTTISGERMLGDKVVPLVPEKATPAPVTHVDRVAANNSQLEQQARA